MLTRSNGMAKSPGFFSFFLFVALFFPKYIFAQDYNPPFPRIANITFSGTSASGHIWRNHDLVVLRYYQGGTANRLRNENPNCIILATNDEIAEGKEGRIGPYPEEWYVRTASGQYYELWTNAHLMDLTDNCPRVQTEYGNLRYNEFLPIAFREKIDFTVFDGIFFDYWTTNIWGKIRSEIDLDRNGIADESEGKAVGNEWNRGNKKLIENIRKELPGKPIVAHEASVGQAEYLNGLGDENWRGNSWRHVLFNNFGAFKNAVSPQINFLEAAMTPKDDNKMGGVKNRFSFMRFGLTSACLSDAYFGADDGSFSHRFSFLYDEFLVNLGYPKSEPIELFTDVYVRYFDNGLVITNGSGGPVTVNSSHLQGGPYYRLKGGQDPDFNNGSQFTSVDLFGAGGTGNTQEGDGIILLKQPTTMLTDIIVDNEDNNMTSPGSKSTRFHGTWENGVIGKYAYTIRFGWGLWSAPFAYSSPGSGENTADYVATIGVAGKYEVFEWHVNFSEEKDKSRNLIGSGASNVPYTIIYSGGQKQGTINQTVNTGKWNSLGVFSFAKGTSGKVILSNNANGYVVADAIKFEFQGNSNVDDGGGSADTTAPNPPKNLQSPEQTEHSVKLTWRAPDPASDGDVASRYEIFRDGNLLSSTSNLQFEDISLGENVSYKYEVYSFDYAGNRSLSPASAMFSTLTDQIPPAITRVSQLKIDLIELQFSEPVTQSSATNAGNYNINNQITVLSASLDEKQKLVHLTTTPHTHDIAYTITVNNIEDLARVANTISNNSTFNYQISSSNFSVIISADNIYSLYVNGSFVNSDSSWEKAELHNMLPLLKSKNIVAIKAENISGAAGVVVEILGPTFAYFSNPSWKFSNEEQQGWQTLSFDDINWKNSVSVGLVSTAEPWIAFQAVEGITDQDKVHWIWSDDIDNDRTIFLRFIFNIENNDTTPPNPPAGIVVKK